MIDLAELFKGIEIDLNDHPFCVYQSDGDTVSIMDDETGELLYCEYLH